METEGINKFHCAQCGDSFEGKNEFKRHKVECERNRKHEDGRRRKGFRKPRSDKGRPKKRKEVKPQVDDVQLQDGFQVFADHNLNNYVGFGLEGNSIQVELGAGEGVQGLESTTEPVLATWDCKACLIQCSDQVG